MRSGHARRIGRTGLIPVVLLTLLVTSAPAVAAPFVPRAATPGSWTMTGGKTRTVSSAQIGSVMLKNLIIPTTTGKAKLAGIDLKTLALTIDMPITGGELNPNYVFGGQIQHTGGLKFVRPLALRAVTVSNFTMVNDASPRIMATVNNNPNNQVNLFTVDLGGLQLSTPSAGHLNLDNVSLLLSADGAALLNSSLRVSAFRAGMPFAMASTHATYTVNP